MFSLSNILSKFTPISPKHNKLHLATIFPISYCQIHANSLPRIQNLTQIIKTSISITIIDNIYTNYSYAKCSCGILCTDISEKFSVLYVTDCTKVSDTPEKYYNEEIH